MVKSSGCGFVAWPVLDSPKADIHCFPASTAVSDRSPERCRQRLISDVRPPRGSARRWAAPPSRGDRGSFGSQPSTPGIRAGALAWSSSFTCSLESRSSAAARLSARCSGLFGSDEDARGRAWSAASRARRAAPLRVRPVGASGDVPLCRVLSRTWRPGQVAAAGLRRDRVQEASAAALGAVLATIATNVGPFSQDDKQGVPRGFQPWTAG